jgi:Flp pilus assembly protein TadB
VRSFISRDEDDDRQTEIASKKKERRRSRRGRRKQQSPAMAPLCSLHFVAWLLLLVAAPVLSFHGPFLSDSSPPLIPGKSL